jgi:hypothetical protein
MIVPMIQAMMRHSLNVEDDEGGLGIVEVVHDDAAGRRHIRVIVSVDDDDVRASFEVKRS